MRVFVSFRPEITTVDTIARIRSLFLASNLFDEVITSSDRQMSSANYAAEAVSTIANCNAFIAIVGRNWDELRDGPTRLIDNPLDPIRVEIVAALDRIMPMVPVLIDGAALPGPAEIAPALQGLTLREPVEINLRDLERDFPRLISALMPGRSETSSNAVESSRSKKRPQPSPEQKLSAAAKDGDVATADPKARFWWKGAATKEKLRAGPMKNSSARSSDINPIVAAAKPKLPGLARHTKLSGQTIERGGDVTSDRLKVSYTPSAESKSSKTDVGAAAEIRTSTSRHKSYNATEFITLFMFLLIIFLSILYFNVMRSQLESVWRLYRVSI